MTNAIFERFFENSIDLDLGLIEIRDDPAEPWTMRAIAGHSVGMAVEEGYRAVRDLRLALALLMERAGQR